MIRPLRATDLPALKRVIDANELFPSDMLDDMTQPSLAGTVDDAFFLVSTDDGEPNGLVYCQAERMTAGTWNMLLIAIHPSLHNQGKGTALTRATEAQLIERGARVLLVETSSLPTFEATRHFYRARGYVEEARIRDFYQAGEDKVVFWKALR